MRRMFAEIDADIYVVTDGDATYDATAAPEMVERLTRDDLDVVTGIRDHGDRDAAYRRGHQFGNRVFNLLLGMLFGERPTDMFSGYRAMSRRFVKSFPGGGARLRDRDRAHRARARAARAHGRGRDELLRAAGRLDEQALDVSRRPAHPLHDGAALPRRAAAAVLLRLRAAVRGGGTVLGAKSWSNTSRPASCRGCRPPCSRPASCCSRRCRSCAE